MLCISVHFICVVYVYILGKCTCVYLSTSALYMCLQGSSEFFLRTEAHSACTNVTNCGKAVEAYDPGREGSEARITNQGIHMAWTRWKLHGEAVARQKTD